MNFKVEIDVSSTSGRLVCYSSEAMDKHFASGIYKDSPELEFIHEDALNAIRLSVDTLVNLLGYTYKEAANKISELVPEGIEITVIE
jgi:hypothetical protein